MDRKEWLQNLKVGDMVAIETGGYGLTDYIITPVTKITPSRQIEVAANSTKFNKSGIEVGKKDVWTSKKQLEPVTEEIKTFIHRKQNLSLIRNTDFEKLSDEKIIQISAIIKA